MYSKEEKKMVLMTHERAMDTPRPAGFRSISRNLKMAEMLRGKDIHLDTS